MVYITNATLVMRDYLLPDAALLIRDGRIASFGKMEDFAIRSGAVTIDAQGMNLAPGLIDIHAHANGPYDFSRAPGQAAEYALRHGVTTILPTLSYTLTLEQLLDAADGCELAARTHANIAGVNMEGPYMNAKYGAMASENKWRGKIDERDYAPLVEKLGTFVKIWSVAPEREGILDFMRAARAGNPGVVFSAGHSDADASQTEALLPYGLRLATHHTNAMLNKVVYAGCLRPGLVDAVNANHDIYAELICDSRGIHVAPYLLRLLRKIKTDERIILISDATVMESQPPENLRDATDLSFDETGGLSGSRLTLDRACRNMMVHTGASIVDVVRFASYNPARLLGLADRGEIAAGKAADLILVDDRMNIRKVFLKGELVSDA